MRELVGELLRGAAAGLDPATIRTLGCRPIGDPRDAVRRPPRGELASGCSLIRGQLRALDRLQAAMSVIEDMPNT